MIAFTQSASDALIPYNIRMNAVAPGLIDTEIIDDVEQERIETIVNQTPMKTHRHCRRNRRPGALSPLRRLPLHDGPNPSRQWRSGYVALVATNKLGFEPPDSIRTQKLLSLKVISNRKFVPNKLTSHAA